jgi:sec-independent protein translocase protein TatA
MGLSTTHLLLLLGIVVLLFGTGKISGLMGDVAKGIKSFKKGMQDDEDDTKPKSSDGSSKEPKVIDQKAEAVGEERRERSKTG